MIELDAGQLIADVSKAVGMKFQILIKKWDILTSAFGHDVLLCCRSLKAFTEMTESLVAIRM
jgi:hypothetical protein